MKTKRASTVAQNNIFRIALGTSSILLIPFLAMQLVDEMYWSLADFVIMGFLLFGARLAYELATRKVSTDLQRAVIGVIFAVALFLIWVELAVGLFKTPFAGS